MPERTYKTITLVGISNESFSAAVDNAIERAQDTLDDLAWFEVKEQRGAVGDTGVQEYQVKLEVAFKLQ